MNRPIKIAIASDTHGNTKAIDAIFEKFKFEHFIFLGDYVHDLGCYANLQNVHKVRGNCDLYSKENDFGILQIGEIKIFFCHGDAYDIKRGNNNIFKAGKLLNADVVLYGHTHKFQYEVKQGIHIINCPALSCVRGGENAFLILEINNKNISLTKHEIINK